MVESGGSLNLNKTDLFLVDCGIEALKDVYLVIPVLKTLNLHSNYIPRIENLTSLNALTHLDLSSNHIERIEGLHTLSCLRHLNLSCNAITIVEGLSKLGSLGHLNLSYNQVRSLTGLSKLPQGNQLSVLLLQGNELDSLNHVLVSVRNCQMLSCLVLEDGAQATNPLCSHNPDFIRRLRENIPSLTSTSRAQAEEISDQSFDPDLSNASTEEGLQHSSSSKATPKIDAILQRFHRALDQEQLNPSETRPQESSRETRPDQSGSDIQPLKDKERTVLENRLAELEKQLLEKRISEAERKLGESESSSSTPESAAPEQERKRAVNPIVKGTKKSPMKSKLSKPSSMRVKVAQPMSYNLPDRKSNPQSDLNARQAVNNTYQQLMTDMNNERERRLKAEEANRLLVQQLSDLKTKVSSDSQIKQNCDDALRKYRAELQRANEAVNKLQTQIDQAKTQTRELDTSLKEKTAICKEQERALSKMEAYTKKIESSRHQLEEKHENEKEALDNKLNDMKNHLSGAQATVKSQKVDLDEMRSLLASRESQHRRDLECRYSLDSPKLDELFQSKVSAIIREHETERRDYEHRLEQAERSYHELEDEFRMALHMEAGRFNELKEAFESLSSDQDKQKSILISLKEKETKSTQLVAELTQLVKQQKEKLISLSKERQEIIIKGNAAKQKSDEQISEQKEMLKSMDRLKKDNLELKNQVQGQHSVISGLRKERELWAKELAQQGAMLSSERGALDSKLEFLTKENKALSSRLQAEVDTVNIKTKCINDLTDTVSSLKQKISQVEIVVKERELEIKEITESSTRELEDERQHGATLDSEVDRLNDRKQELKQQLDEVTLELDELREAHEKLKSKWSEKSASIGSMEQQVKQMAETWSEKEKRLVNERDKAVRAADLAVNKLRETDDAFRKQLETQQICHSDRIHELEQQYELQLAERQQKVEEVEDEMRQLLNEKEMSRKQFDDKLKRVTQAFVDLQNDVSS